MNKFLSVLLGLTLVLSGVNYFQLSSLKSEVRGFGAVVNNTQENFPAGLKVGRTGEFTISSAGAITSSGSVTTTGALSAASYASASVGSSSSTPAALGSAVSGHFIIATGGNTGQASTTAVTANSTIILQREATTPIAGTTCNSTATTTPIVTSKVAGNGFIATSAANPVTNPICLSYLIIN